MCRKIPLYMFEEECRKYVNPTYIFSSENQKDNKTGNLKYDMSYDSMRITFNPNTVTFAGDGCMLNINDVRQIDLKAEPGNAYSVYDIICNDALDYNNDNVYTILVQEK